MSQIVSAQNIVSIGYVGSDNLPVSPFCTGLAKPLLLEHSAGTLPPTSGFKCSPAYAPSLNAGQGINLTLLALAVPVRCVRKERRVSDIDRPG